MTLATRFRPIHYLMVATTIALISIPALAQTVPGDISSIESLRHNTTDESQATHSPNNQTPTDIAASLGIDAWTIQSLAPIANSRESTTVDIQLDDRVVTVSLISHSLRTEDFTVNLHAADGTITTATVEPARTFRGIIVDQPGSAVAASIVNGQLTAMISKPTIANGACNR